MRFARGQAAAAAAPPALPPEWLAQLDLDPTEFMDDAARAELLERIADHQEAGLGDLLGRLTDA